LTHCFPPACVVLCVDRFKFRCTNIEVVQGRFNVCCGTRQLPSEMSWEEMVAAGLNAEKLKGRVVDSVVRGLADKYKTYNYDEYIAKEKDKIRALSYAFYVG
jgi:hypothetical protein